ncbi:MAG TPA: autotransporter-associated beta strand repeat-containing protein [Verrucomicrobiae bacterium]|nr:autotransporter-associated beta strand repeat-containing protein [Verrucomicrobiae bacterium]
MKKNSPQLATKIVLAAGLLAAQVVQGANSTWSGASGTDLFWSTAGNWSPSGVPATTNDALFFDAGASNDIISTSSIISANQTIRALRFGQTNAAEIHNLFINSGVTLTVAGTNSNGYGPLGIDPTASSISNGLSTVFSGPWPGPSTLAVAVNLTNTISGPGALVVNNTNNELQVRYTDSNNQNHYSVLDMSGLNHFNATLGRIGVGYGQAGNTVRAMGRLLLAKTNTITLTGTNSADNVQLVVGDNSGNNNGNNTAAFLYLGLTNRLNVDKMLVGGQKTPGTVLFNASFTSPSLVMRGSDGVSRVSAIRLGDESDSGATGSPTTGILNLLAGTSDILVDTVIVGKSQNGNNTSAATGNLLVGSGTFNANSLTLGAQANSSYGGTVTGTASFSNTIVTVNTLLQLGLSAGAAFPRVANLNVNGGSMTVNGTYINQGTVNISVTNATLTMPTGAAITARNIQLDGGSLANVANLKATNALNIFNNGSIAGTPILDLGSSVTPATWDVQAITNGSLTVSNALQGAGTINGNVIQAPGAILSPGGVSKAGTLNIGGTSGNLTLNHSGTLNVDLSTTSGGANDVIAASGTVTLNGTNNVFLKSLGGSLDTTTPYTLITSATLVGDQTQFKVVGPLTTGRYTFSFDTATVPNTVRLVVGGTGPASQIWVGDGSANVWDAQGAFNWTNGSSSQFFNLDNVTFNDTGSVSPPISVSGALVTGSMTVSNSTKSYAFGGTGTLAVAGALSKSGTGGLVFSNRSDNSFSSLTTVSNGTVNLANNGQNTFAGGLNLVGGSFALSGNSTNIFVDPNTGTPVITIGTGTTLSVLNSNANTFNAVQVQVDGTLAFNQPVDATFDALMINAGSVTKSGSGKLIMSGNNSGFNGTVVITGGTVVAGSTASALGTGGITVTNTGALDLNGKNIGAVPVVVSGAGPAGGGALVNTGSPQNTSLTTTASAVNNVTLTNSATFGGSGPWNTDPIQNLGYFVVTANLSTSGTNYNLTKTGANQISLFNATVDPALGNLNVQQGMLNFQGSTTSMGDPGSNLTVSAGATISFYDTATVWDKKFILNGDGVTPNIWNYNGTHTIAGAMTLNGSCVFGGAPVGRGLPVSITLSGPLSGGGSFIKSAADPQGAYILAATNTYTGTTTVGAGTLFIEGVIGTNATTVNGGVLAGIGVIRGPVTVASGGRLAPGDANTAFGVLIISNSLSLGGTCSNNVDKTSGVFSSSTVTNLTTLTLGGTLQLNLTGDALVAGDTFKLFSFGSASGSFSSINPSSPGTGLAWDTSGLTVDGTLKVIVQPAAAPVIGSVTLTGSSLVLNITNGVSGGTNIVMATTNLVKPLNQWTPLATNVFDVNGNSLWTNAISPAKPQEFYLIQLSP